MATERCWLIDNYEYRACRDPGRELGAGVILHTHCYHSKENLGTLNEIMALPILRFFNQFFRSAFRGKSNDELDYSDLHYSPPISPEQVWELERQSAERLGCSRFMCAITDHDCVAGPLELLRLRRDLAERTAVAQELSIFLEEQIFHLCVIGIPPDRAEEIHAQLQELSRERRLDDLFDLLAGLRCLVIFNHPFYKLNRIGHHDRLVEQLLGRYAWAMHAFEFNGMRPREENERTLELARAYSKPVVGGGDRHAPIASLVISSSREAGTMAEFIEEVRGGRATAVLKRDFFVPQWRKLFVRILHYVAAYRWITFYRDKPLSHFPIDDRIIPDYFAGAAGLALRVLRSLHLVR